MSEKFYLTTPIYYVNARPHIGHAYTTIVADVLARRHRLLGHDTFFLTGTDEHGQKIERSAAAAGIPPQQFADEVSAQFKALWDRMGLTYNRYIRTTDECHKRGVQHLFTDLYNRGHVYLDSYTGSYCVSDEAFVDLPAGTPCPDCGKPLETVTEENFFFRLSAFQKPLLDLIESNQLLIEPSTARNEVLSFVRGNVNAILSTARGIASGFSEEVGHLNHAEIVDYAIEDGALARSASNELYVTEALKDLSISRSSFTWGIPVPEEIQQKAGAKGNHVIYVWLDALANYMTAIGYGSDKPEEQAEFQKYWPADLHLVGKEITRFHCVYWPAFLMAAGLPLPKRITANGWLLFDNAKMSKSRGNVVRTETILEAFGSLCPPVFTGAGFSGGSSGLQPTEPKPTEKGALAPGFSEPTQRDRDLFASDVLRYFLLREIPFGQDGSFSFDAMVTRYNADLANGYGNLVSRTLSMITKYCDGIVPNSPNAKPIGDFVGLTEFEMVSKTIDSFIKRASVLFEPIFLSNYCEVVSSSIRSIDGFITAKAPWKIAAREDEIARQELRAILYTTAESLRIITILLHPLLPFATTSVWRQLGLDPAELTTHNSELATEWGGLKPGTRLGPLAPIFPRADKSLIETMLTMEDQNAARPTPPLKSATTPATHQAEPSTTFDPAAPPRTASIGDLDEPSGELPVGGSNSVTTERLHTPHTEATPSGPFASPASQTPITAEPSGPADGSPQITIDDFAKVELRVAQILVAERIPKADKLLRLEVDLGYEKRQILSGIAEYYTPEDLIGRRIIVITNLAPRKMRGLESHGMLLAASSAENPKPILATMAEDTPLGLRLK